MYVYDFVKDVKMSNFKGISIKVTRSYRFIERSFGLGQDTPAGVDIKVGLA